MIGGRRLGQAAGGRATALAYQRHVPVEQKRHHTGQHRAQAHSTNRLGAPTSPSRCSRTFRTRQTRTCSTNVQNTTQPVFVASSAVQEAGGVAWPRMVEEGVWPSSRSVAGRSFNPSPSRAASATESYCAGTCWCYNVLGYSVGEFSLVPDPPKATFGQHPTLARRATSWHVAASSSWSTPQAAQRLAKPTGQRVPF